MRSTDLLHLTWIADPQISPDGSRIAYTRVTVDEPNDTYKTSLWVVPATGGTPRALTFGPASLVMSMVIVVAWRDFGLSGPPPTTGRASRI